MKVYIKSSRYNGWTDPFDSGDYMFYKYYRDGICVGYVTYRVDDGMYDVTREYEDFTYDDLGTFSDLESAKNALETHIV